MKRQEIKEKLQVIFRDIFRDNNLVITDQLSASEVEAWDSLNHIDMIISAEEEFKIKIPTMKASQFNNAGELIDFIDSLL